MLEVTNMEYRDHQFYVRIMTDAIHVRLPTSLAKRAFVCCSLIRVNLLHSLVWLYYAPDDDPIHRFERGVYLWVYRGHGE